MTTIITPPVAVALDAGELGLRAELDAIESAPPAPTKRQLVFIRNFPKRLLAGAVVDLDGPRPVDDAPCWTWASTVMPNGYGRIGRGPRNILAHRAMWMLLRGPIPDGLQLDHLCRNRACVNPAHLEPVTNWENTLRGEHPIAANIHKTQCPKEHPYDEENTYRHGSHRYCRACSRESQRARAGKAASK